MERPFLVLPRNFDLLVKASNDHCFELNPKKCQVFLMGRMQTSDEHLLNANIKKDVV